MKEIGGKGLKKFLLEWILILTVAIVASMLIRKFLLFKVRIPTGSMIPTVEVGDELFVTRIYKESQIKRGDILVFEKEGEKNNLLKRVVGMPGEEISIKENGDVYINGEKLNEEYVKNPEAKAGEFRVPEKSYFMLGDNRIKSQDARDWENPYIPFENIIAKSWIRVHPFNRFGKIEN